MVSAKCSRQICPPSRRAYRFVFNPIRYTSLGLAVLEAMMIGIPIVGLATTEMVTVVENGVSGYLDTNVDNLIERCRSCCATRHWLDGWAKERVEPR